MCVYIYGCLSVCLSVCIYAYIHVYIYKTTTAQFLGKTCHRHTDEQTCMISEELLLNPESDNIEIKRTSVEIH